MHPEPPSFPQQPSSYPPAAEYPPPAASPPATEYPPPSWAYGPPPGAPAPGSRRARRMSRSRRRVVATLAVLAFLAVPAIAGYEVGKGGGTDATATGVPSGTAQLPTDGSTGSGSPSGGSSGNGTSVSNLNEVAAAVDDVVVNINSEVDGGGEAAGTGIVISANGLAITNNHVIAGTTGLTVEFAATGATRPAKLLGYSVVDDVALIQIQNVSNLKTASIGTSSSLDIGETVLSLGNAGGRGGSPTVVSGSVTALDRQITASDSDGSNSQTLQGLVELAANIQSGDSGGPVVDTDGNVVAMTVAASVSNGFGFPGQNGAGEGYAIPIETAMTVAKRIIAGEGGTDIRIGSTRAVLGVQIQPTLTTQRGPAGSTGTSGGAQVVGVQEGSGAAKAGLTAGDTIVAIEGKSVSTLNDLTRLLVPHDPGDSIEVTWRDSSGQTRRGSVELGEGPPA